MKNKNNLIYFEDTDTSELIKDFFLNLQTKEAEIESDFYGKNKKFLNQLGIDELISQVNNFKFKAIDGSEKNKLLEILNKEKSTLNNDIGNVFETKISAFLSLIDYIVRNHESYPHIFNYTSEKTCDIGFFKGIFSEELTNIQTIVGENPFSFYVNKIYNEKTKLPKIDFNSSLNKIFLVIKNNFISDFEPNSFEKIYKNYLTFKSQCNDEKKVKP